MSKRFKTIVYILVSVIIGGGAATAAAIGLINLLEAPGVSHGLEDFATVFLITFALPGVLLVALWLDKIMDMGLLPEEQVTAEE